MATDRPYVTGRAAAVCLSLLVLGCATEDPPIGPGTGGTMPPKITADGGDQAWATGRLCEVEDFTFNTTGCKPILNSGLIVSTYSTFTDVENDGSFQVKIAGVGDGHVPVWIVSTDTWFGGSQWVDAEPGQNLYDIDVPAMKRDTMEDIVVQSGNPVVAFGDSIIVMQASNFSGLPLDNVAFGPIEDVDPYYGGAGVYAPGDATTTTGTGVYFGVIPYSTGFEVEVTDSGNSYTTHGLVANDNFTIIPIQLSR
jgi:hypothetical protein